jgi:L-amino acid N-acyltransferase YncA
MEVIQMLQTHWPAVRNIYLQGIATKQATFQTDSPSWEDWDQSHVDNLRYVAVLNGQIVGWAALSPVSSRCVYAGVCEVSIYVQEGNRGKGVGATLLQSLITNSERNNIWTLQSGIFPENISSIALHEKFGFRKIGLREKVGKMDGIWRDVLLMERRSKLIGQD